MTVGNPSALVGTRPPFLRTFLVVALIWSALIGASLLFNLEREAEESIHMAQVAARANIFKDMSFRKWATMHGGVYVPPTPQTPPNPYLTAPDEKIVTSSGKELILMNPGYMLRQLQNEFGNEYGIRSRITSLTPINPLNAPDEWEAKSLKVFDRGVKEAMSVEEIDGEPYMRLMLPFVTEEGCLKCHVHQGYQVGDIRGGIGTAVSMRPFYAQQANGAKDLKLSHGVIWLIGFIGISAYFRRNSRHEMERRSAELHLLESELQHRTLADSGQALIWTSDTDKLCTYFNKVWLAFTGRTLKQELGNGWAEGVHPDDLQRCLDIYNAAFDRRVSFSMEYRLHYRDGDYRWIVDQGTPRFGLNDEFIGYIGHCMDITERKQTEIRLANSEKRLELALGIARQGWFEANLQTGEVSVSPEYPKILGFDPDSFISDLNNWMANVHPDDLPLLQERFKQALATGKVQEMQYRRRNKAGEWQWIDSVGQVTAWDASGSKPLRMTGVHMDITQRKQREVELAESEERYRNLTENSSEWIWSIDLDGRHTYSNNRGMEVLGLSRDKFLATAPAELVHPEDRSLFQSTFEYACEHRAGWRGLLIRWRHADGSYRTFESTASPKFDKNGVLTGFSGVDRDVTERIQAEAELQRYREHLEDLVEERTQQLEVAKVTAETANVAKSAFLANMSHEIRTPLNAITGMAHILRRSGLTSRQTDKLDKIETAGNHLLEIINAILDLSKIEAGKFTLEETLISIDEIVGNVASMIGEKAKAKGIALNLDLPQTLQDYLGDRTRLQQALLNYATNAIKFTEHGRVTLRAVVVEDNPDNALIRLEVTDTGPGIAPDAIPRLFHTFEQADNTITRKYGGTGLGLAITRRIAELMGGQTGAESAPGKGSTFWMTVRLPKADPESEVSQAHALTDAEMILSAEYAGTRMLLAEDEPVNREVTLSILGDVGLLVDIAEDGAKALERKRLPLPPVLSG